MENQRKISMAQVILRNTPEWYAEYIEGWIKEKKEISPAERVIMEDILTLVNVARSVLEPEPEAVIEPEQTESAKS